MSSELVCYTAKTERHKEDSNRSAQRTQRTEIGNNRHESPLGLMLVGSAVS